MMIHKRIKRLDFVSNSLKDIWYIQIYDSPSIDRDYMEWFMQEVQRSLMIPLDRFDNLPAIAEV